MANRFFPNYPKYRITSPFGVRVHPVSGVKTSHSGIDLVAFDGKTSHTDYIAAHSGGVVESVSYDDVSGHYVRIEVASGILMVYCHLKDKSALKKGASVKKGDIIGYMGSTGRSTGAHLHFGIKKDGVWIDPEPYLDKDYSKPEATVKIEMSILRKGSKGTQVKTLQRLLLAAGYFLGGYGADGDFGSATESAVRAFQGKNRLEEDGCVGQETWSKLLKG